MTTPACPLCRDLGWVLDGDPTRAPLTLDLIRCPAPDCDLDTTIEVLALHGLFARAVAHPSTRVIMSVAGHRDPLAGATSTGSRTPGARLDHADRRAPAPSKLPPGARPAAPGPGTGPR